MSQLTQTIALEQVAFFAYHGLYAAEQLTGTTFLVDVSVTFYPQQEVNTELLTNTVNYEQLYHIIATEMNQTQQLLESVAKNILQHIQFQFDFIHIIKVTIRKQNLPMTGRIGNALVQLTWNK